MEDKRDMIRRNRRLSKDFSIDGFYQPPVVTEDDLTMNQQPEEPEVEEEQQQEPEEVEVEPTEEEKILGF